MEIPGLGTMTFDEEDGYYTSEPIAVPVLDGKLCQFIVEGYESDLRRHEFQTAIKNFLTIDRSVLKAAEVHLFEYFQDCTERWESDYEGVLKIKSPADIWPHIRFGREPTVSREDADGKDVYISLECGCDWEKEHGLQIVFKNGLVINKVGAYDGSLNHSDENVIYPKRNRK